MHCRQLHVARLSGVQLVFSSFPLRRVHVFYFHFSTTTRKLFPRFPHGFFDSSFTLTHALFWISQTYIHMHFTIAKTYQKRKPIFYPGGDGEWSLKEKESGEMKQKQNCEIQNLFPSVETQKSLSCCFKVSLAMSNANILAPFL